MARPRKRHVEALQELAEEAARFDFIEKHRLHLSFVQDHWYAYLHTEEHCAHSGDQKTAREAIDACRKKVQERIEEERVDARWRKELGLPPRNKNLKPDP